MAANPHISSQTDVACTHCGLSVPPSLVEPDRDEQFCCHGCRTVHEVINSCGLERFYGLRESAGEEGQRAKTTARAYAEFDDDVFHDLYARKLSESRYSVELYLEGVHCSACVWLVEKLPRVLPGVISARLNYSRSLVEIVWEHDQVKLSRIAQALDQLGYPAHPAKDARARESRRQEDHRFLVRIGVAAACAGNVMSISFALYGGMFNGIEAEYARFFRWISLALGLMTLCWPGRIFFQGAWAAIRTRTAHLDLPIAIALGTGTLAGLINVVRDAGDIYFDSLTMLIFLLLVGRWIQRRQQRWAADAVELMYALTPSSVRVLRSGEAVEIPVEAVQIDEIAEVRADESIAVDGEVIAGESSVNQSLLTGEAVPIPVQPGDKVAAGTINCSAPLQIRVKATGEKTRVGQLMQLVEQSSQSRAAIVCLADRIAGWFVVVVLALAALTFGTWMWLSPGVAIDHTVALLIVACPCALGLATPLIVSVAIGQAATRGVLIKGGDTFEALAKPGILLLDKTGTVTEGRAGLTSWFGSEDAKPLVAALEAHATHPLARAMVRNLSPSGSEVNDIQHTPGGGISGTIEGKCVVVGSPAFMQTQTTKIDPDLVQQTQRIVAAGQTPVQVAVDDQVVSIAGFRDPLREDACETITQLQKSGWDIRLISGDHRDVVARVGEELGLPAEHCHGQMSPEDKLDYVRTLDTDRVIVMAGDGVNDAAALAAANVGLAVHGSAEASLAAADAYLSRPGLQPIAQMITASRRALGRIRSGLGVSLGYNAFAATLAMLGWLGPLTAAVLMPISSLTVLTLALTTRPFGKA